MNAIIRKHNSSAEKINKKETFWLKLVHFFFNIHEKYDDLRFCHRTLKIELKDFSCRVIFTIFFIGHIK